MTGTKYAKNSQEEIKKCVTVGIGEFKIRLKLTGQINRIRISKNSSKSTK